MHKHVACLMQAKLQTPESVLSKVANHINTPCCWPMLTAVAHKCCEVGRLAARRGCHVHHGLARLRRQGHARHEAAGTLQ